MSKSEKLAFLSTIFCLLFMIMGVVSDKMNWAIFPIFFILAIISGGWKQTYEGIEEIIHEKQLNVDLLMALAAIGACLIGHWFEGAMLTFIFCLSGALEEFATNKSTKEITSLMEMKPTLAVRLDESGNQEEVEVIDLAIGDQLLVAKGSAVPIDGKIIQGRTIINEAAISGESLPVEKAQNDEVFGSTINEGTAFTMVVTKENDDTLFAKIIQLVEEAQNTKSQTASYIEKIENVYVKVVLIAVPLMILLTHLLLGWTWTESFYRGMVLLVVASPCALVASATPATLAAISNGAKHGVLFKGGNYLENLANLKAIAFDKTGTLTVGKPQVTDLELIDKSDEVIDVLIAMESQSVHPLAEAIVHYFDRSLSPSYQTLEVKELPGYGLEADWNGHKWKLGKHAYTAQTIVSNTNKERIQQLGDSGKTVIFLSKDDQLVAYLGLLDRAKSNAAGVIQYFNQQGIQTVMLTGDHKGTARLIADQVGVREYHADCLPEDKTKFIQQQKEQVEVNAMVGDGINDAPALASAAIGVAMGEGTDVAMDVADMVLMKNDLQKLQMSHQLSLKLRRIIKQNIVFSLTIILLLIISNFSQLISLPLGVVGHEGSTILVILNGLRMLIPIKSDDHSMIDEKQCSDCVLYQYAKK